MWYHYIALLIAAYLIASSIYSMIMGSGTIYTRWVFNALYAAIGVGIGMWAWSGITAPTYPTLPMMGGRRRRY
jgi:hypothetical protein